MRCVNGRGRGGRYYGSGMDAVRERMGSRWTLLRPGMDALRERMGSGWTLLRPGMGALRERMGSDLTVLYDSDMDALLRHVRNRVLASAETTVPTVVFGM